MPKEGPTVGTQANTSPLAVEEFYADLRLQKPDGLAERGLGHPLLFGSAGHVLKPGSALEILQLLEIHEPIIAWRYAFIAIDRPIL